MPSGGGGGINVYYLTQYKDGILFVINGLLAPILLAVAFLSFLWGVYNYFILGAENSDKISEGRSFVIWAVIGFVVIFSLWGLVGIAANTFNLQPGGVAPSYPLL